MYCENLPSIKPELNDESVNKGIQSWLPQTKLTSSGAKLRHSATVDHKMQDNTLLLSVFWDTDIHFHIGLLLDNVWLKWLIYGKYLRRFL